MSAETRDDGKPPEAGPKQEIELKRRLVGERAADALVAALGPPRADHQQTNHVFDTPAFNLRRSHCSLRVRDEDGTFTLTAKGPGRRVSGDVSSRTEAEVSIERDVAEQLLEGERDPVAVLRERALDPAFAELFHALERACADARPIRMGQFGNRRRTVDVVIPGEIPLHVEVDQTRFPGGQVDEEVEIELARVELAPVVEAWLASVTRAAGIETQPSSPKLGRFYAALAGAAKID